MKTAIYIQDGLMQLVLTPDTEFERATVRAFSDKPMEVKVMAGSFYNCQGGWVRHDLHDHAERDDRSLILRVMPPSVAEALPDPRLR